MTQYIDKAAVVAEINRQHKKLMTANNIYGAQFVLGFRQACRQIIDFLNTLEVKDVDLEKKINEWLLHGNITDNYYDDYCDADIIETANYFFELGLKTQKGE